MLLLFLTAFSAVFVALTLVYLSLQDQQARLVWVLVYLLLVQAVAECMNWSTQRLADKGIYLQVGHASQVLVEVWLVWVLAALLAVLYTWFTLPPKRSQE